MIGLKKDRMTRKTGRIKELDALRGIAAIIVMLYHYTFRYFQIYELPNTAFFSFSFGHLGVELFFLISGFVIIMSVERIRNSIEFMKKRCLRLFPAYWVALVFSFIITANFGMPSRQVNWSDAIINLTMLQEFVNIPHVDKVYWSLSVELSFYILVFLSIYIKKDLFVKYSWIVLAVLSIIVFMKGHKVLDNTFIFKYYHLFYAGSLFYYLKTQLDFDTAIPIKNIVAITALLVSTIAYEYQLHQLIYLKFIILFYIMFFLLIKGYLKYLSNRILLFLGAISYPLYLVHNEFGIIIINFMQEKYDSYHFGVIIASVLSIFVAWVITDYAEPNLRAKFKPLLFKNK